MNTTVYKKLIEVQNELKAPKNQYNNFGKYSYRSCEDILEALKPICLKHKAVTIITDEIVNTEARYYVKATAKFIDVETGECVEVTAAAREEETKKGMDGSQITGSSSSYARKYALNGLFCIDDTKDADATNTHGKASTNNLINEAQLQRLMTVAKGKDVNKIKEVLAKYKFSNSKSITKDKYDVVYKDISELC